MTTLPECISNSTSGMPFNLIISNNSDYLSGYESDHDYYRSLGYAHESESNNFTNVLPDRFCTRPGGQEFMVVRSGALWFSPDCQNPQNPCLQFSRSHQTLHSPGATFINAAIANATAEGIKVIQNGYDLARDQFVKRATSNHTGVPVFHHSNHSTAFKTTVVYNDTELLANMSANNLEYNIGTDRRVPILLVEKLYAPFNETPVSYPQYSPQVNAASPFPTMSTVHYKSLGITMLMMTFISLF